MERGAYLILAQVAHVVGRGLYDQPHDGVLYHVRSLFDAPDDLVRGEVMGSVHGYSEEAAGGHLVEGVAHFAHAVLACLVYLHHHKALGVALLPEIYPFEGTWVNYGRAAL